MNKNKYTQRQWDRVVGWGKVPDEYNIEKKDEQKNKSVDEDTDD